MQHRFDIMGKLKKGRRNHGARHNPLKGKKNEDKQTMKDESTRQSKIIPLISKLKSTVPNEKSMAIGAITVLAEDERMRHLFMKERLIVTVMEYCLNDSNDELVAEAYGLLRNLGIEEGYDVAKFYWRSNIWTSIEVAINKIETSFKFLSDNDAAEDKNPKQDKSKLHLLYDFTDNILSLIVVIASGSEDLFEGVFAKIGPVLNLVVKLLSWNTPTLKVSSKLFNSLLDFLYEFSSESQEFIVKLFEEYHFDIESFAQAPVFSGDNKLAKIYIEGLKFNYYEGLNKVQDKALISNNIIFSLFQNINTIDLEHIKSQLIVDNAAQPIQKEESDDKLQDIDQQISGDTPEITKAKSEVQAIHVAVDITTSILEYLSVNESNFQEPVELSNDLNSTILNIAFPSLIELLKFDQSNNSFLNLTDKNLITLNNLCWLYLSSKSIPVEWFVKSLDLWNITVQLSSTDNLVLQKDCLNVLWAISKTIGEQVANKVDLDMINNIISKSDELVKQLDQVEDPTLNLEFVLVSVGFLGSLAPVLGQTAVVKLISEFLLSSAKYFSIKEHHKSHSSAIEIALESLNLIYDIFDDTYDYDYEVFVQGNYIDVLKELEPQIKALYKQIDKNKEQDLKLRAEEIWTNLGRFIQYKINERK